MIDFDKEREDEAHRVIQGAAEKYFEITGKIPDFMQFKDFIEQGQRELIRKFWQNRIDGRSYAELQAMLKVLDHIKNGKYSVVKDEEQPNPQTEKSASGVENIGATGSQKGGKAKSGKAVKHLGNKSSDSGKGK